VPDTIKNRKFLHGYPNKKFMPNNWPTRAEVAQMLYSLTYNGTRVNFDALKKFSDVNSNDWYSCPVAYFADRNLLNGHDGKFYPNEKITRAEMSQFVFNVLISYSNKKGELVLGNIETNFKDIKDNKMSEAIRQLASNGIIEGYGDDSFKPDNNLTRAEMVVMISRAFDLNLNENPVQKFLDVDKNYWAFKFINSYGI
jgi:hypothetical protein